MRPDPALVIRAVQAAPLAPVQPPSDALPAWPPAWSHVLAMLRNGPVTVLTGAGLSTGSGIPAYRDRSGQWRHAPPIQHQDFLRSAAVRRRYWARSFVGWPIIGRATPNQGHRSLVALERAGAVSAIVTQNVDGLHQQAGSMTVIELHGAIRTVTCLACRSRYPRARVEGWLAKANPDHPTGAGAPASPARGAPDGDAYVDDPREAAFCVPDCPACGGILKPDVVFFGDGVPREKVAAARQAVEDSPGLLVVGSSLMVYSGYRFAEHAHRLGRPVIAINDGLTRADALLSGKIEGDCGAVLAALAARLSGETGR